jgi:hypothetical protein
MSAMSDRISHGQVFPFLFAFCNSSRRLYDTYMTLTQPSGSSRTVGVD